LDKIISKIVPGITFDNGFLIDDTIKPFYNFQGKKEKDVAWSGEMSDFLDEVSKEHFLDQHKRRMAREFLKETLSRPSATFLEIGTSSGYMLEETQALYPNLDIVGSDYEPVALQNCHKRLPHIPLIKFDITDCPIQDSAFDAISCLGVLEHIDDDRKALSEIGRILSDNGLAVITVPAGPQLFDYYDEIHFHYRRYSKEMLTKCISESGLNLRYINYFGVFIYPPFYIVKKLNRLRSSNYNFSEKKQMAIGQAKKTKNSKLMSYLCKIESKLSANYSWPFGIRLIALVAKN